jgi:hypothetical protein
VISDGAERFLYFGKSWSFYNALWIHADAVVLRSRYCASVASKVQILQKLLVFSTWDVGQSELIRRSRISGIDVFHFIASKLVPATRAKVQT